MKKNIIILIVIFVILIVFGCIVYIQYNNLKLHNQEIYKFNSYYEEYNKETLNGLDITTLINKAISNNEKYGISKDEKKMYILDDEYSIEIYVTFNNNTYQMEKINNQGIEEFVGLFGSVGFKCTNVKYHEKTKRIASMTFEALDY